MNKRKRYENDLPITWYIEKKVGDTREPFMLAGIPLTLEVKVGFKKYFPEFEVEDNSVNFTLWGKDQKTTGNIILTLWGNYGEKGMWALDTREVTELVHHSWEETDNPSPVGVIIGGVELTSVISLERGPRGYSAYEIALQNGFVGTEDEWLASLHPSITADEEGNLYCDNSLLTDVVSRVVSNVELNEQTRQTQENARQTAEGQRATAEQGRASAESGRVSAEASRASQSASDHMQAEADHAVMEGYNNRLDAVEGEVSQLEAKVTGLSTYNTSFNPKGWRYTKITPFKKGKSYEITVTLAEAARSKMYIYLTTDADNQSTNSFYNYATGIPAGNLSGTFTYIADQDRDDVYLTLYLNSVVSGATMAVDSPSLEERIVDLEKDIEELPPIKAVTDSFLGKNINALYDGHLDQNGSIVVYGSAKFFVIPICGGDNIELSGTVGAGCFVLKDFDFDYSLPYTPIFATGESCRGANETIKFTAPLDAKYLLVRAVYNDGSSVLPGTLLINGTPAYSSVYKTLNNRAIGNDAYGVRLSDTILATNVKDTGNDWTLEILFKAPNLVNYQDLISYHGYYVQLNAASAVKIEGNTTVMDKVVNRNNPVHIVFSHDSESKCTVWLNGEKVTDAETHAKYNNASYNQDYIKVGLMKSGRGNNGVSVFHIRLFSSAIGDSDAIALWNNGKPDKYNLANLTGLIAQYKGMSYPFAWLDSSGNNNHLFPNEDFVPTFDEPYEDEEQIRGDEVLVPIKANKIWRNGRFWQGACLVGDKVVGFGSSEDDHSNNGSYFVYNPSDLMEYLSRAYHNIGHCNSVDYNPDADCIITTSSATKQTTTHSPVIHLVGNASAKVNNGQNIYYDADDVVNIELSGINGLYTGVSIFGETSDIAYLVTIEDPAHYDDYKGRWLYRVMLGKGDNDLTTIFPSNSFGTFVSGKSATEYNGTAHIDAVFPFESRMELQGGKYINGAIVFSSDIYLTTERILQSYLVKMEIDVKLKNCKITEMLWIPTRSNAGALQRTESEECVIIGNRVLHQVIIHGDTNVYQVHDYQLP